MANKTEIVDPNNLTNSLVNNTPVALDDLTISVELTTEKKGRTLLVTDNEKSTNRTTDRVRVNFIEGSNVNGKPTLTTKFTDLTTNLDSNNNPETLGISAIDIEFNTAFAPLITIQFIDVRGSAIFQNEDKMGSNKYSVFFQLPYPLYTLTIKGYYGQPVSYCLHMTKFTSRFNSQTGNFEITTSFIGYTYAMLSDLLLGYLKAIPYTKIGADKYKVLKDEDNTIFTLDELYKKISLIDENTKRILADNDEYKDLSFYVTKLDQLEVIRNNLNALNSFEVSSNEFVISEDTLVDTSTYIKNIINSVDEYNSGNKLSLDTTSFNNIILTVKTKAQLNVSAGLGSELDRAILVFINNQQTIEITNNKELTIIDNRDKIKQLDSRKERIESEIKILKDSIAKQLEINVVGELGFNPTIRTLMKSITSAAEVFLQTIYTVSSEAEADITRAKELEAKFGSLDIKQNAIGNTPTNSSSQGLTKIFYPWPEYKKSDNENGYVETYIGSKPNELTNPNNVTEVRFIDDLLKAFLESDRQTQIIESEIRQNITSWIPTNPLDTRLFNEVFPYKRMEFLDTDDVMLMILIRAMTFLGVSNLNLTDDEIIKMAEAEINAIIADLDNKGLIDELKSKQITDFLNVFVNINGKSSRVVKESTFQGNKSIIYNYILDANDIKIIPINGDFKDAGVSNYVIVNNSTWPTNVDDLATKAANGSIFLTNYELTSYGTGQIAKQKVNDGGIYVKFITRSEYNQNTEYPLPIPIDVKPLNLLKLQDVDSSAEEIGYNIFGGPYGIQTFDRLNYGFNTTVNGQVEEINDFDYRFMFYKSPKDPERNNSLGSPIKKLNDNYYGIIDGPAVLTKQKSDEVLVFTNLLNLNETNFIEPYNNYGKNTEAIYQSIKQNKELTYPFIDFYVYSSDVKNRVSLFGSRFYYEQTSNEAKAILFLHTFPWNGLVNNNSKETSIFTRIEILKTFNTRAGFISVPKLWAAFIGGMLWRSKQTTDPIRFYNQNDPFIPFMDANQASYPTKDEYLTSPNSFLTNIASMVFESGFSPIYLKLGDRLTLLPDQAKDEFIRVFEDFVRDDWGNIKSKLEIYKEQSGVTWKQTWNNIHGSLRILPGGKYENLAFVKKQLLKDSFNNFDNYIRISPIWDSLKNVYDYNYILQLKDNVDINKEIISLYKQELILINTNPNIWGYNNLNPNKERGDISIGENSFNLYINTILGKIKGSTTNYTYDTKQAQNEIFGNTNENLIKLQLYRTCKNIYDKWVGYSNDEDVMFQCGGRNLVDTALANKRSTNGATNAKPRLIDSFRFVTRSFEDIGDIMAINPTPLIDYLGNNINTSSYDMITSLLSGNNFDFVPLPSFINYRDPEVLSSIFKPYPKYNDVEKNDFSGPSFVCMYVGQTSKSLDFNDSNYPNDGFDATNLPSDFTGAAKDDEDVNTFFKVGFGQQNQNIFKDVVLDQSEFGETAESLQIIDNISQKGGEQNKSFGGQNLYNVYSVRSYKAEIEMLGNAMIQPMMYFQLDNIPMFHGAYMITRVKHSIKPNTMSTNFTGVRIKTTKSPIFTTSDFYMSFLETIKAGDATLNNNLTTTGPRISGSYVPIVVTLIETGGFNGYFTNIIEANKLKEPILPKGITYLDVAVESRQLITQAADALTPMLEAWVSWMIAEGYVGNNGAYAGITSMFRTIEKQRELYDSKPKGAAALPGTSMHGWGLAIDFQFYRKNGERISNYTNGKPNLVEGFNFDINESLIWLVNNSYKYGWLIPEKLRDGNNTDEFWHFEYHGKSAPCFIRKNPIYVGNPKSKSITIDIGTLGVFSGILNPSDKDGKEAIYTNCDDKYVSNSDGTGDITSAAYPNILPDTSQLAMVENLTGNWVERAATIIKQFEGITNPAKIDAGKYRGGYGTDKIVESLGATPVDVKQGTTFTVDQATWSLSYDIENRFYPSVISSIGENNWDLLNGNQKASLISYVYNSGASRLKERGITDAIVNKDYVTAAKLIGEGPITSEGKVLNGLVKRRKIESQIFAKAV